MEKGIRNLSTSCGQRSKVVISVLVLSLFASAQAKDSSYLSYKQELYQFVRQGGRMIRKECKDVAHSSVKASNIEKSLQKARSKRGCQSVKYYLGVIQFASKKVKQQARYEIIDSYLEGRDSFGAVNAANYYLGQYGDSEVVRFRLIEIARKYFSTNPGRDPFWEKMILGIHKDQHSGNPLFQNFVAEKFLKAYPRTKHKKFVEDVIRLAVDNVDRNYMEPNKHLFRNRKYKAVIFRMQPLWLKGPESGVFAEAMYDSIYAFIKLAGQIKTVGQGKKIRRIGLETIDEQRIRELLEVDFNERLEFTKSVDFLNEQANILMGILEANTGARNKWTKKARQLFK